MARVLRRVVLDAGPVVSLLLDDAAADTVARELGVAEGRCISVVNVAEILDVLRRVHRVPADDAAMAVERVLLEVADPVDVTLEHAARAADIRTRHYHRRDRDLSLADCFVLATAGPLDIVATSDTAVARAARAEGLDVLALPNARGRRPTP